MSEEQVKPTSKKQKDPDVTKVSSEQTVAVDKSDITIPVVKEEVKSNKVVVGPNRDIILDIGVSKKYTFITTSNGVSSDTVVNTDYVLLTRGNIFKLPITDASLNLDNFHVVKISKDYRCKLQVLDVGGGYVTFIPLLNNLTLRDKTVIGSVI